MIFKFYQNSLKSEEEVLLKEETRRTDCRLFCWEDSTSEKTVWVRQKDAALGRTA
jgi:hypothetical protein